MSNTGHGFQIEYPSITLHAISRQDEQPSIYCQLDEETEAVIEQLSHADLNGTENEEDEQEEQGDEVDTPMRELSIIPQNPQACKYHLVQWFIYADGSGQWRLSSMHCRDAQHCIQTLKYSTKRHSSVLMRILTFLTATKTKNSVKSGGCAVILSIIADLPHTRPFPFPMPTRLHWLI